MTTIEDYINDEISDALRGVFKERALLDHIKSEYAPEEVFDEIDLHEWAQKNGYVYAQED